MIVKWIEECGDVRILKYRSDYPSSIFMVNWFFYLGSFWKICSGLWFNCLLFSVFIENTQNTVWRHDLHCQKSFWIILLWQRHSRERSVFWHKQLWLETDQSDPIQRVFYLLTPKPIRRTRTNPIQKKFIFSLQNQTVFSVPPWLACSDLCNQALFAQ